MENDKKKQVRAFMYEYVYTNTETHIVHINVWKKRSQTLINTSSAVFYAVV